LLLTGFLLAGGIACGHGALPEKLAQTAEALRRTPDDPRLLVEQAELLVEHGDHALAKNNLERVDVLAPGVFPTDFVRARLSIDEGDLALAEEYLNREVARTSSDPRPLALRARTRFSLGKRAEAFSDYKQAWVTTAHPQGDFVIEVADAFVSGGLVDEAEQVLRKGIEVVGRAPSLLTRLVDVEVSLGRPAEAVIWVEVMQARAPRPEPWMARRAELLAQAGNFKEAREAWVALRDHLSKLPNLERGSPALRSVAERVDCALREKPAST